MQLLVGSRCAKLRFKLLAARLEALGSSRGVALEPWFARSRLLCHALSRKA